MRNHKAWGEIRPICAKRTRRANLASKTSISSARQGSRIIGSLCATIECSCSNWRTELLKSPSLALLRASSRVSKALSSAFWFFTLARPAQSAIEFFRLSKVTTGRKEGARTEFEGWEALP